MLEPFVKRARQHGASDIHLEPGLPAALRICGALQLIGETSIDGERLLLAAKKLLGPDGWEGFLSRRSADLSRPIAGVPCRINVLQTARGLAMAVRLLADVVPTVDGLNLMPEVSRLVERDHGLVLITGPTGSGKSSTMAALIEHLNRCEAKHILTIEAPIEYHFHPRKAFIRQRQVGRDTPSFSQALIDALREDPDVIMVGEMRRGETIQRTLDAAETGHLVLATMHAATVAEALQRIVSAFAAESQAGVRAQLADCFVGGLSQTLVYNARHKLRIPECEILMGTDAIRASIRDGAFYRLHQSMTTGAAQGMWTVERYRRWVAELEQVQRPGDTPAEALVPIESAVRLPPLSARPRRPSPDAGGQSAEDSVISIDDASDLDSVIAEIEGR